MKYEENTLVRVRTDLKEEMLIKGVRVTREMSKFVGKDIHIKEVYQDKRYLMREVSGFWNDAMLLGRVIKPLIKLKDFEVGVEYTHHFENIYILDHSGKFFSRGYESKKGMFKPANISQDMLDWCFEVVEEPSFIERLRSGQTYYFLNDGGQISKAYYFDMFSDAFRIKIGNCFETHEQAEEYKTEILLKAEEA